MLATLYSLGTLITLVLTAYGIGRPLVRWLKAGDDGVLATTVWSMGLGFVATGCLLSAAAFFQVLTPLFIVVMTIAGSFWGLGEVACAFLAIRNPLATEISVLEDLADRTMPKPPGRLLRTALMVVFAALSLGTLAAALAPPISPAALSSSLELPKTLLRGGSIYRSISATASPQFGSMIYGWALVLDGPVAATLISWFFGMLLAAATALLARPFVGRAWGWCAGSLVLLAPGLAYQMSAPLDDLMMAAFATLALAAWWRGAVEWLSPRWFIMAGLFLGAALATKAVAVILLVAAAITWIVDAARHGEHRHELALGALTCITVASVVAIPWWAWSIVRSGTLVPLEGGPSALVQWGPWFFAIVPGLFVARRLRGLHLLLWLTLAYLLAGWLIVPHSRAFAPLVPFLATISTWICIELSRLPTLPRRVAISSLTAIAGWMLIASLLPVVDRWSVACGAQSRADYLRRHVGTFAAAEVANRVVHRGSRLLSQDGCALYFDCPVVTEADCRLPEAPISSQGQPAAVLQRLFQAGFTHLLLCSPLGGADDSLTSDTLLAQAVGAELAKPDPEAVLPLTEYYFTDITGRRLHYQLLMLRGDW